MVFGCIKDNLKTPQICSIFKLYPFSTHWAGVLRKIFSVLTCHEWICNHNLAHTTPSPCLSGPWHQNQFSYHTKTFVGSIKFLIYMISYLGVHKLKVVCNNLANYNNEDIIVVTDFICTKILIFSVKDTCFMILSQVLLASGCLN